MLRWRLVALVAVSAAYLNGLTSAQALEHMRTYRPDVYIPAHHDGSNNNLWRATEPLFQAMKDANPDLITVSKGYREPGSAGAGSPAAEPGHPLPAALLYRPCAWQRECSVIDINEHPPHANGVRGGRGVEQKGIEPSTSALRTLRSPN